MRADILIVTVTTIEAQTVLDVFARATNQEMKRVFINDRVYYELGAVGEANIFMVQSEMGSMAPDAAILTVHHGIEDISPCAVIMVGVAFGTAPAKSKIGDILVAKYIQAYEPQKIKDSGDPIPRGVRVQSSPNLLNKFRSGNLDWKGADIHFGLVLSGEKLIDDLVFRDKLIYMEPEAIGGEMEGAGLYAAAEDAKVDWILIKGICDWADGKKDVSKIDYQRQAALNSTEFVLHVVKQGGIALPTRKKNSRARVTKSTTIVSRPSPGFREDFRPEPANDLILLIGAGVSNYLGMPTLNDLLQQAILGDDDVANRIRSAHRTVQSQTRREKALFEELIGQLRYYQEIGEMLRRDNTFREALGTLLPACIDNGDIQNKWRDALTRCYRIILQEYGPQKIMRFKEEIRTILDLLGKLARLNSGRLHVYTTNYDCSFQVFSAKSQDVLFFTHINNQNGAFQERWYMADPNYQELGQPSIYIHRFHGCVGWFKNTSCPYGIEEVYGAATNLTIKDDNRLHGMQIKLTSGQSLGLNPAFTLAFEEFCEHLKTTKVLLVWGYSFRDLEVLRYINQAYAQQPDLSVLYIDPFLNQDQVIDCIRSTMVGAPIVIHKNFKPKQIDWTPTDGPNDLIQKVLKSVEEQISKFPKLQ